MADITIQFSRAAPCTWVTRNVFDASLWICRLTHSPFSHVDLVLADGSLLGASYNPGVPVLRGSPCGVAVRPADYQLFSYKRRAVMRGVPRMKADAFEQYCMEQIGKPFDSAGLKLSTFLSAEFESRDWRDERQWYCAELMARATEVSRLLWWDIVVIKNRITAADYLLVVNPLIDVDEFYRPV